MDIITRNMEQFVTNRKCPTIAIAPSISDGNDNYIITNFWPRLRPGSV